MNPDKPLYVIKDWDRHFEARDTRRCDGPLRWVPVPTKTDGFGFSRLRMQRRAPELLAAWYLILGVAAKQPRKTRGRLERDGRPLGPVDLALMTGFPDRIFVEALEFFSQPAQGWLVAEKVSTGCPSGVHDVSTGCPSGAHGASLQDRTGQDNIAPGPEAGARVRARNELFDALAKAEEADPLQLTPSHAKRIATALAEIKRACPGLTAAEVAARAADYRRQFRDAAISAHALAKNWAKLRGVPKETPKDPPPAGWRVTLARLYPEARADIRWEELTEKIRAEVRAA